MQTDRSPVKPRSPVFPFDPLLEKKNQTVKNYILIIDLYVLTYCRPNQTFVSSKETDQRLLHK